MSALQLVHGFAQRGTNSWDACQLFRRQVVEILVHRFTRMDLVLDAVKTGHQQG